MSNSSRVFPLDELHQTPVGTQLCFPAQWCPWVVCGSRLMELSYNTYYALNKREDINTHTSKPTKQMMKVIVKWLFLHPYFPTENDADQKQKLVPKAALPALQLKSL